MTTVLVVDDDPAFRVLLFHYLAPVYLVLEADNGEDGIDLTRAYGPSVVLLDLDMPGIDGYETCRRLKSLPPKQAPIVIIVSAHTTAAEFTAAMGAGADDYIAKPVDRFELSSRVSLHLRLQEIPIASERPDEPEIALLKRTEELANAMSDLQGITVSALAKLAETRDSDTGTHLVRIRDYSMLLARTLQRESVYCLDVDEPFVKQLHHTCLLHDIGKVGIPDSVLLKPGRLNAEEMRVMKQHTVIGWDVLTQAAAHSMQGRFLMAAAVIARSHHERWDGAGYPDGLSGEEISLGARIVAVADVFDALTTERSYKAAWSTETAYQEIVRQSGRQFDPIVVEAFKRSFGEILKLRNRSLVHSEASTSTTADCRLANV